MSHDIEKSLTVETAWAQLPQAFGKMLANVRDAGNLVVFLLDNDTQARDKFRKLGVTPAFYLRLEKVGRGLLLPELADSPYLSRLPIDQQRQVVQSETVAVIQKANGEYDTLKVDLLRADLETVRRVAARDHLRTPAEQRMLLERKSVVKTSAQTTTMPWRVVGKTIVIKASPNDLVWTRTDLLSAMKALEA